MFDPITSERAKELAGGLYGEVSAKSLAQFVVPFFFGQATGDGSVNIRNGSAFFVKTTKGVIGLTADHVIGECLEASSEDNFLCGLFPVNFTEPADCLVEFESIEDRIIDRNENRDIATFWIKDDELNNLKVNVVSTWPPITPETGKGIGFCGFPSVKREIKEDIITVSKPKQREIVVSFMVFPVMAIASSISEYQITYVFDWEETVKTQGFQHTPADLDLGGMSGGPALAKLQTKEGIEYWGPAGVITEGKLNPKLGDGRIFAARIDECLGPQGKISK